MKLVANLIKNNKAGFGVLLVTSIMSGGLNAAFLAVVTYSLTNQQRMNVALLAALFVAACLGIIGIRYIHRYLAIRVANSIASQLRIQLSRLIQNCSASLLERKGRPHLLSVLTNDLGTITGFVMSVPMMLGNVTFLAGATVYLAGISDPTLFACVIAIGFLATRAYGKVMRLSRKYYQKLREESETALGYQTDLIAGYKELKMDTPMAERLLHDCMVPSNKRLAVLARKAGMRHMTGLGFGMALIYSFIGVVVFTFTGFFGYPPEVVVGYTFAIIYAAGPLQSVIDIYPGFIRAGVAVEKVEQLETELLNAQEERAGDKAAPLAPAGPAAIRLVDVEYSYHGRNQEINHLGPFNLTINKNEVLFIAGGNGSGKTTLAKLICGLYRPDRGKILCDGAEISNSQYPEYRNRFSAVFSDFHILKDSPDTYDLAGLLDSELLEGFELDKSLLTREGLAGSNELSQGQRRRLALLLAIHAGKPVYLFDEPGSDLDPAFKKYFYRHVLALLKRKGGIVIVITHDDNYFPYADRIVTLRDGRIISNEAQGGAGDARRGSAAKEPVAG